MKKNFILFVILLTASLSSFAQNIVNPLIESSSTENNAIIKIETDKLHTIVSFEYTAASDDTWARIDKGIYLRTPDGKRYNFVKAENITLAPTQTKLTNAGDKLSYKVYFQKLPATAKTIDIVEKANPKPGENYFNYQNVSLTEVAPPAPVITKATTTDFTFNSPKGTTTNLGGDMMGAMTAMGPMLTTMATSMMDAQLNYYKQPGKLAEVAKLHKQYFDELVNAGFTSDQALKIITADSLLPKTSGVK